MATGSQSSGRLSSRQVLDKCLRTHQPASGLGFIQNHLLRKPFPTLSFLDSDESCEASFYSFSLLLSLVFCPCGLLLPIPGCMGIRGQWSFTSASAMGKREGAPAHCPHQATRLPLLPLNTGDPAAFFMSNGRHIHAARGKPHEAQLHKGCCSAESERRPWVK